MKKHAYLVMVHDHASLVNQLLGVLDDPRNDIFLHIDAKASDAFVRELTGDLRHSNIYLVDRINVHWGAFSQIEAELSLLKKATKTGKYAYYHLISGSDLPIKSQKYIHQFFDDLNGRELVQFQRQVISDDKLNRVKRFSLLQEYDIRKHRVLAIAQRALSRIQRTIRINRISSSNITFQMGSNWFSITDSLARYVVTHAEEYLPYFRHSQFADELFLQTIVINSDFKNHLFHQALDDSKQGNMRFIIWVNHAPRDLVLSDFENLKASDLLFARKFNPDTDQEIITQVVERLAI